jgi:hypothetical protein
MPDLNDAGNPGASAPLPSDIRQAAALIHASPARAVLYVTGGAAQALSWLLCVPGASRTVLDAAVPYSRAALLQLLRGTALCGPAQLLAGPISFSSASTAAALAAAAYRRAVALADRGDNVVGIAATCSLVSTEPKRGSHRAFVAAHTDESLFEYELVLDKGERDRLAEDDIASRLVIQALVDTSCFPPMAVSRENTMSLVRDFLVSGDSLTMPQIREHGDPIETMLAADEEHSNISSTRNLPLNFLQLDGGRWRLGAISTTALLPGSFNPLHQGHRQLLEAARSVLGPDAVVGYELAVTNVDKPPLDPDTLRCRARQFVSQNEPLVVSRAPMFVDKARMLPNHVFIIGHDTATRLVNARYYGSEQSMLDALMFISQRGCRFLVGGRRVEPNSGPFLTLDHVQIPTGFGSLFSQIPEHLFREDISSTMLRKRATEGPP